MQSDPKAMMPLSLAGTSAVGPDNQNLANLKHGDVALSIQGRLPQGWSHFEYAKAGTPSRKSKK